MTKELLQQALDALNESIDCVRTECAVHVENYGIYPGWKVRIDVMKSGIDKHEAAIAALELAIAQPVPPAAVGAGEHNFTLTENHIELLATLLHYTGSGEIQKDLSAFCHDGRAAIATKAQAAKPQGAA